MYPCVTSASLTSLVVFSCSCSFLRSNRNKIEHSPYGIYCFCSLNPSVFHVPSKHVVCCTSKKKVPSATTSPNVFFESFASGYLQLPPPVEGWWGEGGGEGWNLKN